MEEQLSGPSRTDTGSFALLALIMQGLMIVLFFFVDYDLTGSKDVANSSIYNMYVGVALMMFVGFGYLMTFLRAYGLGAVGFTMFITCLGVEWALLVENTMSGGLNVKINMMSFLNANTAVAAVLISFGGLIGKISPTQVFVVTVLELLCYCANKVFILTKLFDIQDCGGTIIIHVFGAYFGLAACAALGPASNEVFNSSSYTSDLLSFVGTVFLWLFWPSFVAGGLPAGSDDQNRALMNTVLALLGSTVAAFGLVPLLTQRRLSVTPIANATLAGGVAIGATANFAMGPAGAVIIGTLAGLLSCFFFCRPIIASTYDTCGINNLHGLPGIFGGLVSVILPMIVKDTGIVWWHQLSGLACTLAVASGTGFVTGLLLKRIGGPSEPFDDGAFWEGCKIPKEV
jgi:ammonium transporter Rh